MVFLLLSDERAPAHCNANIIRELIKVFEDRWIRLDPSNWPARLPDLTSLDYFLWGHMKDKVYRTQVHTTEELLDRVRTTLNAT